jgi:hypothetical protein
VQLLLVAKNRYYAGHALVADSKQPADCLMIVSRGLVEMCLPVKDGGRVLSILRRGYELYEMEILLTKTSFLLVRV